MNKRFSTLVLLVMLTFAIGLMPTAAQDAVELRFTWYSDGNEGDVMRDLLDRFEAENPDISVVMDVVAYQVILDNLPVQVEAGEGPDMARITNFGGYKGYYLDLRPYLADADAFEASFAPAVLNSFRTEDNPTGLHGFADQVSVTLPFVNMTLFEQAGVALPGADGEAATWEDWTEASRQVAEATGTPYAIAIDRTGHRIAGPAISMGATILTEEGNFTIDTPGFRHFAELLKTWHDEGITPREVWLGSGGNYAAAADFFINGELVVYMSGTWQTRRFATDIADAFDWSPVANPSGEGGSTGIAGGAGLVAFNTTEHPEAVGRVMEYLAQPEVYTEYSARTLFLPAQLAVQQMEIAWDTEDEAILNALSVAQAELPKLTDQALALNLHPFAFAYFTSSRDRLTQWMLGEIETLDEALERIQQDIDETIAAAAAS